MFISVEVSFKNFKIHECNLPFLKNWYSNTLVEEIAYIMSIIWNFSEYKLLNSILIILTNVSWI